RRTALAERRLVSMADMHLAAFELTIEPRNWSGNVAIRSAIDGRVVNSGAKLYERFNNRHLEPLLCEAVGADAVQLVVRTSQSNLHVAIAARTQAFVNDAPVGASRTPVRDAAYVGQDFEVAVREGDKLSLEKVAALYSSRDQANSDGGLAARAATVRAGG